jgi:hypothetical protein
MGLIAIIAPIAGWQFNKHKPAARDHHQIVAAEVELQRERGLKTDTV